MARADRLLERAKEHFVAGESALAFVGGAYETKVGERDTLRNGVLIATNQRILFYTKRLTSFDFEAFSYEDISSLETGKKLGGRWIKFSASGNAVSMKWIHDDVTAFVDTVQSQMAGTGDGADQSADATSAAQPDEPDKGAELAGREPEAEKDAQANSGKRSRGCLRIVLVGLGAILGVVVVLLAMFAVFGPREATEANGHAQAANAQTGTLLGRWHLEIASTSLVISLVHRDGVMYQQYFDGSPEIVVERPSRSPSIRKFDPNPDEKHGEYFTISASGVMKSFAWEGREINSAKAEHFHPDAMSIGFNPVERPCAPTELSALALETMRLYEELHSFKDTEAFAVFGFGRSGYLTWMQAVQRATDEDSEEFRVIDELGFAPLELRTLGLGHMDLAREAHGIATGDLYGSLVDGIERTIRAGIALAECRPQ